MIGHWSASCSMQLPRVPELSESAVVVEGVVDLVGEGGAVHGHLLLAGQDVQVSVWPALYPGTGGHGSTSDEGGVATCSLTRPWCPVCPPARAAAPR